MTGPSHICTNICSFALLYDLVIYTEKCYSSHLCDYVNAAGAAAHNFIKTPDGVPAVSYFVLCAILYLLGTLLPDTDSPKSLLGRFIHIPVAHRTWTHAVWIPICIFILSIFCKPVFWLGLGYILHIFWDSLSRGGICWFYPISKYKVYDSGAQIKLHHPVKLYRVGKASEYVVLGILILTAVELSILTAFASGFIG